MDIYFVIRFFISSLSFYIVKAWKLFIRFNKWNCRWWKSLLENRFLWAYLANIFDLILSTIGEIFMDSVDFLAIVSKIWLRILKQMFLIPKVKAACILCINFKQKNINYLPRNLIRRNEVLQISLFFWIFWITK